MDWKEFVMYVLELEGERQNLISKVATLKKRKLTLEDRLDEAMPWKDKSKKFLSRAWSYTFTGRNHEMVTRESLKSVKGQLNPAQTVLRSLEEDLLHEARKYIQDNPGFDKSYDAAKQQLSHLTSLTYRVSSLHEKAENAVKDVTTAKKDYEYSQRPNYGEEWWLRWGRGRLRGAKKEVEGFTSYDGLVEQISAYLPNEAHTLENGIKLARMLDLDHIERLSKQITHLTKFEKDVARTKNGLNKAHEMYKNILARQIQHLLTRIRDGAF